MTLWWVALLALGIGFGAGLLGAGASFFTVLVFIHVAGLDPKTAIATALVVVALMSAIAVVPYARSGAVLWKAGLGFSVASMTGAYVGGHAARFIPTRVLMAVFVLAMLGSAGAMFVKRSSTARDVGARSKQRAPTVAAAGLLVGALTGAVGLGGGFVIVPLLLILVHARMRSAVGTSLFVIALDATAGLAGHMPHLGVDWRLALATAVSAAIGGLAGAKLGKRIDAEGLRPVFAIVLVVGAFAQLASSIAGASSS
jgi:uncharacterized membrane protein YfcA